MSRDRARQIWLVGLTIVGAVVGFVLIIILSIVPVSSETVRAKVVAVLADRFDAEVDLRSLHVGATTRRFVPAGSYNWRGARTHALITNIWYPTESSAGGSIHSMGPTEAPWFRLLQPGIRAAHLVTSDVGPIRGKPAQSPPQAAPIEAPACGQIRYEHPTDAASGAACGGASRRTDTRLVAATRRTVR